MPWLLNKIKKMKTVKTTCNKKDSSVLEYKDTYTFLFSFSVLFCVIQMSDKFHFNVMASVSRQTGKQGTPRNILE